MPTTRIALKLFDPLELIEADRLRRDLMLVDRLAIDEHQLSTARSAAGSMCLLHGKEPDVLLKQFESDLETLGKLGRLTTMSLEKVSLPADLQAQVDTAEETAQNELKKGLFVFTAPDGSKKVHDPIGSFVVNRMVADLIRARHLGVTSSTLEEHRIPFATGRIANLFAKADKGSAVLRIVLSALPTPGAEVPWEQVLEFTSDAATQHKLAKLREWMVEVALKPLGEADIQTKLEAALSDYRAQMKEHQIESRTSTVEVLIVTTAEMLENLAKLKFGAIAKGIFQLFRDDRALMKAELAVPGRELAFIDAASVEFSAVSGVAPGAGMVVKP